MKPTPLSKADSERKLRNVALRRETLCLLPKRLHLCLHELGLYAKRVLNPRAAGDRCRQSIFSGLNSVVSADLNFRYNHAR
jgi:hypothetical protein